MYMNRYARLAEFAYAYAKNKLYTNIDGFVVYPDLSDSNSVVLINQEERELVLSIRGTDIRNKHDLVNDFYVMNNALSETQRYRSILNKTQELIQYKMQNSYKLILTGHSLGASLCLAIAQSKINDRYILEDIDGMYLFNTGFSLYHFTEALKNKIKCKILNNSKTCKLDKLIKQKIHIYSVLGDPISNLSFIHGGHIVRPINGTNPHSISQMIGDGWETALLSHRT